MEQEAWMTSGAGHPRRRAMLSVLLVAMLVVVLDATVLNLALPTIQRDLGASQSQLVWAIDAFILTFAGLLFTCGVLGDKYGRKRVLIIGLLIFGVSSAACAFSGSASVLIAFRALMGVGGSAVLPISLAVITVVFPPHERGRAIGLWAATVGLGVAIGPIISGVLLSHPEWTNWLTGNDWGSVFLINVPIVAVGVFFVWRIVPETKNPARGRLDLVGVVLSITGLTLLIYGIIDASTTRNWLAPSVVVPVACGVGIIACFLWYESRSDHASFDVSLFTNRGYAVSLTAASLAFFAMSGVTFILPFYLQMLRGYTPLVAGLCFVPFAIGQMAAAPRSAAAVSRFGYRAVMTTGLLIVSASTLAFSQNEVSTPIWIVLTAFLGFGVGMGLVVAPAATVMQNVLPLARVGAGSAVQNTVRHLSGALGVAVIGTLVATQYATNLQPGLDALPPGVPQAAKDAASESIIATAAVLEHAAQAGVPATVLQAAADGAFAAFTAASEVASFIILGVVIVATIATAFLLPTIHPPTEGGRALEPPQNPTDALVQAEAQEYPSELAAEFEAGERHHHSHEVTHPQEATRSHDPTTPPVPAERDLAP